VHPMSYGRHPDQVIEVLPGAADRPLIVVVHGGFWRPSNDRSHAIPLARALAAGGHSVLLPEYRRRLADPDATVEDIREVLARANDLAPNNGSTILIGHSAGGHLVLWAASSCPPPELIRVIALGAVADLAEATRLDLGSGATQAFLGGDRPDLDPVQLPTPPADVVLINGEADTTVPMSLAESYLTRHPRARLIRLIGASHMDLIDPRSSAWPHLVAETTVMPGADRSAKG
jgi:acetyl esterase/lipase